MQFFQQALFLLVGSRRWCLFFAERKVDIGSSASSCLLCGLKTSLTRLYGSGLARDLLNEFELLLSALCRFFWHFMVAMIKGE